MTDYELETSKRFTSEWRNVDTDELADPTTMNNFVIYDKDLNKLIDEEPEHESLGKYYCDVTFAEVTGFYVGTFMYEWNCVKSTFPIVIRKLFGIKETKPRT